MKTKKKSLTLNSLNAQIGNDPECGPHSRDDGHTIRGHRGYAIGHGNEMVALFVPSERKIIAEQFVRPTERVFLFSTTNFYRRPSQRAHCTKYRGKTPLNKEQFQSQKEGE